MYCLDKSLQGEKWVSIDGYEGIYEVSNMGRVRSVEGKTTTSVRHGERKWKQRVLKPKGMMCESVYKTGYRVSLWKEKKSKDYLVARLVAFNFFPGHDITSKETVDHLDGNRLNNKLDNLDICSRKENIRRSFENQGLHKLEKVRVTNKKKNETQVFPSMSQGSRYMNKYNGYLSAKIKQNKNENEEYTWEMV